MNKYSKTRKGFYGWLAYVVEKQPALLVTSVAAVTLFLLIPLFLLPPTETASDNPSDNNAVMWYNEIQEQFPSETYSMVFIAEAKDGDLLTQENLLKLYRNSETLREGHLASFLIEKHTGAGETIPGLYTIADAVNSALLSASNNTLSLDNATDEQVKQAADNIFTNPLTAGIVQTLSIKADAQPGTDGFNIWTSPALILVIESERNNVIQNYPASVGRELSSQLALEHFGRDVLFQLRGHQEAYNIWGLNIDLNLTIADQGRINTPMLLAAIGLILVIVTIIFRSFIITIISGIGLGMVLVWLKGLSNLFGLKSSVILDLIVPIIILVLGIDYAIHAIFRYREEKQKGFRPPRALGNSTYGVGSALIVAMLTTIIAFGANAVSGIESIVEFAFASSMAMVATFIILGLFVPAIYMWYENDKNRSVCKQIIVKQSARQGSLLGGVALWFSSGWFFTLPVVVVITFFAVWGWLNLDTKLDPKEALDPQSDFVVSIDKLEEHVAQRAGELAIIYVKGDFTSRNSLIAFSRLIEEMDDNEYVARRSSDGKPAANTPLLNYMAAIITSDYARQQVELETGVSMTNDNNDLFPDTAQQIKAVYDYITKSGISLTEDRVLYTSEQIRESLVFYDTAYENGATQISIGVPGTREQAIVRASADELNHDMEQAFGPVPEITFYGLTGEAYVRDAQFSAITNSMMNSFIVALAACLVLLIILLRSIRYAVVTLIPMALVVCWLYGLMFVMGYHINLMTATIAAISVGVGIDFSVHFTERFRQELKKSMDKSTAIYNTARTTGAALLGTTLSTASGFAVIAFAPMPMFATFGVLTATMIALSFMMAILVLPSLLLLFTPAPSN